MINPNLMEKVERCYVADAIGDILQNHPIAAFTVSELAVFHGVNEMTIKRRLDRILATNYFACHKLGSCYLMAESLNELEHYIGFTTYSAETCFSR